MKLEKPLQVNGQEGFLEGANLKSMAAELFVAMWKYYS